MHVWISHDVPWLTDGEHVPRLLEWQPGRQSFPASTVERKNTMTTVRDTRAMLAGMMPVLKQGNFVFCTTGDAGLAEQARSAALIWFREDEGIALILEREVATSLGFDTTIPMSRIVLEVFSALDGVGLTAAVSTALASNNIPCNMVSAYHHDNVFVPVTMVDRAMHVLHLLQAQAQVGKPR